MDNERQDGKSQIEGKRAKCVENWRNREKAELKIGKLCKKAIGDEKR
jgi:hypothetical protein